ncbi:MAG: IS1595 family transposase [Thermoguttaceae bacterium]
MPEDCPRTLTDFERRFSSDDACRQYLSGLRWPRGFVCPKCAGKTAWQATRERWVCGDCRYQATVTAGTIFQDSHLPLTIWFRAMWYVTNQADGARALDLQRILGLGSYKTAWAMLHKLRRVMASCGRTRLLGVVEVDELHWRRIKGVAGRLTDKDRKNKTDKGNENDKKESLIMVAAEDDGTNVGRIRLRCVPDLTKTTLHDFVTRNICLHSTVRTDRQKEYLGMKGYIHDRQMQGQQTEGECPLSHVHRVMLLLTRWLLNTPQGATGISPECLDSYLDEFAFRFRWRKLQPQSELFYRLTQQSMQVEPAPFDSLCKPHP